MSKDNYMSSEITRELLQTAPVEGMPGWETRLFLITNHAETAYEILNSIIHEKGPAYDWLAQRAEQLAGGGSQDRRNSTLESFGLPFPRSQKLPGRILATAKLPENLSCPQVVSACITHWRRGYVGCPVRDVCGPVKFWLAADQPAGLRTAVNTRNLSPVVCQ